MRCGACDALLEFETTIGALFGTDAERAAEPGPFCIRRAGYDFTLAALRVGDLIALPPLPGQAVESVLRRCVLDARREAGAVDVATLPAGVRAAVSQALAHADPRADLLVALACDCGVDNTVVFDIGTFLWEALDRCVLQTLADVHALASAYGWAEREKIVVAAATRVGNAQPTHRGVSPTEDDERTDIPRRDALPAHRPAAQARADARFGVDDREHGKHTAGSRNARTLIESALFPPEPGEMGNAIWPRPAGRSPRPEGETVSSANNAPQCAVDDGLDGELRINVSIGSIEVARPAPAAPAPAPARPGVPRASLADYLRLRAKVRGR